jgi:hypothetical protein
MYYIHYTPLMTHIQLPTRHEMRASANAALTSCTQTLSAVYGATNKKVVAAVTPAAFGTAYVVYALYSNATDSISEEQCPAETWLLNTIMQFASKLTLPEVCVYSYTLTY